MTNALNELHGRIAARQRQRARPGRSFFEEARKAAISIPMTGHTPDGQVFNQGFTDTKAGSDFAPHELTSDNPNDESHFRAFTTALNLGLDPLHERRKGHSRVFVICSDADWKVIEEVAK